ncbi:hypothetical protein EDL98_10260 [Ornithobacterium rhinotracheale]|uniref:hypothetical protein n=1 Tax=Ornithobacterium rhinotracheale TaxID=28251 RepID=UPI00129CF857|nr:hypothetical protein [Ornithobacterium rhinotracheale]MRJ11450.1 hypothetical protein [Ornithobacterium rhinotracheale]
MYKILGKDTIKNEIIPHLPRAKRDLQITVPLEEVVNAIIFKLKTGTQWHLFTHRIFFQRKNTFVAIGLLSLYFQWFLPLSF